MGAAVEWPLVVSAVVFLIAYAAPIVEPDLHPEVDVACSVIVGLVWALFVVDYGVRLWLSPRRWVFVRSNLFDLTTLTLPLLRPLRLLRLLALLSVLNRASSRSLRGKAVVYAIGGAVSLLVIAALAITDAERGLAGSSIDGIGDGMWWAITTMTTVGYGDTFPVTTTGRCVAVVLMIAGIALLGVVTGIFASWLVGAIDDEVDAAKDETQEAIAVLTAEVRALRAALADRVRATP
ncbi:voltage-gated potassium channel [Gordonia spumicola]|uniref:Voltage-gated potassium channel n=1 Tax=Gordonia spumicola TaxID=589161 RepID=A0A7I9VDK6_9ACTN|nr:potassium channel family protein [Gordonia spumicola]GEE03436.1 voltage-gated potassium channel [Gordonia spumicola]